MFIDYKSELNPEQYKVVTKADGPCLILAGAGSGKTRTIVYRVAYLIEKGVNPQNILLLTFTNKAAREMVGRAMDLLQGATLKFQGRTLRFPFSGTFHHFANLVLRKYAPVLGYKENFTILDEEDSRDLIKNALKTVITNKEIKPPSPAILQALWSYCRNSQHNFKDVLGGRYPKFYSLQGVLWQVLQLYEKKKKTANVMDFDDLLLNLLSLLKSTEEIRNKMTHHFKYILVDEYQDTNWVQAQIIYYLTSHYKNILVVGDDAQSIYSFRAAEIKNILDFPKVFPETKIYKLEKNYRSTPEILGVANEIISKNFNQYPKILRPASPKPSGEGGPVCDSCVKPFLIPAASTGSEAKFIAEEVLRLRDEGVKPRDIAVLFRAAYQSEMLEMELNRRGIAYEYRGGMRFFERAHIKDAAAFLRILNNFRDEPSWLRILNLQEGIGEETSAKIFENISKISKFEDVFYLFGDPNSRISGLLRDSRNPLVQNPKDFHETGQTQQISSRAGFGWQTLLKILKKINGQNPRKALESLIESDYGDYLIANYPNAEERMDDLKALAEFASRYENLNDFLSEMSLQESFSKERVMEKQDNEEKIILSTVHQAKGLEWNSVFVIGLVEKQFPHYRAMDELGGVEEERRLFYVAATRAKRNLYFSYSLTQGFHLRPSGFGGQVGEQYLVQPSRFVREIPPRLLEKLTIDDNEEIELED